MNSMVDITPNERRIAERVDAQVTSTLAISDRAGGIQFANAGEAMEFAKMLAISSAGVRKHLRGNPGACLAIVVQSIEWGLSPYAVANKSYFVNDQIAYESQLIQAVILRRAPIKGRIKFEFSGEGENRVCRAWAQLRDDPGEIVEYISPPFKSIQPKNSPLWKNDPDQQHCYYSGRALCRRHFPDVLLGIFAEDDIAPTIEAPKDVAPAKSLTSRLDVLAGGADAPEAATSPKEPIEAVAHDPETGEVDDSDAARSAEDEMASDEDGNGDATGSFNSTPRDALLHDLRSAIMRGDSALKLLNELSPEQNALLTKDDKEGLKKAWKDFQTATAA